MCAELYIKKTTCTCSGYTKNGAAVVGPKAFCYEVKRSFGGLLVSLSVTPVVGAGSCEVVKRQPEYTNSEICSALALK